MSGAPHHVEIGAPDQIDRLIAHAATLNLPGRVELLRAVRAGAINLVEIERKAPAPMRLIERSPRPVVMLLGDDDYAATGPAGWVAWQRLSYWAPARWSMRPAPTPRATRWRSAWPWCPRSSC